MSKALSDFLELVTPPGAHMSVIAIHPVNQQCFGQAYTRESIPAAVAWLAQRQEWNQYWTPNPLKRALNKKPLKDNVAQMRWVHADIDVLTEDALARLRGYRLPPSMIIMSGGGYQAFWKLREPIAVNGNIAELEAANLRVLQDLDPAHPGTQNLDRIMRLPGTTNWPTEAKLAKGRKPVQAMLIEAHPERVYSLDDFGAPAPGPQPKPETPKAAPPPPKDKSASADLMRRVRVEVIAGDSDDAVHEKFADHPHVKKMKQEQRARAIQRCIDKARASIERDLDAEQRALAELNAKHAVVSWGGKVIVLTEKADVPELRLGFELSSMGDFRHWYANRFAGRTPLANFWIQHPQRRQYGSVIFAPQREVPGAYNLWRGFGVNPVAGDCQFFLDYILEVICSGDRDLYKWVISWCADAVQNPGVRPGIVIVLRGPQGTGKGTFARELGALFGRHFLQLFQAKHLVGNFNSHLANTLLLFADECFWAGDKQHEGVLKALITELMLAIEFKGKDLITVKNFLRIIMASNKDWVVPAALDDRRFCVIDIGESRLKDYPYFKSIADRMKNGGSAALLDYLLKWNLSGVELRDIPATAARLDQQLQSMDSVQAFWYLRLNDGAQLEREEDWLDAIPTGDLFEEYANSCGMGGERNRAKQTAFGIQLNKMCPGIWKDKVLVQVGSKGEDGGPQFKRMKVYGFPPLAECRAAFAKYARREFEWDQPTGATRKKAYEF